MHTLGDIASAYLQQIGASWFSGPARTRTWNQSIMSAPLCRLSYRPAIIPSTLYRLKQDSCLALLADTTSSVQPLGQIVGDPYRYQLAHV